MTATKAANLHDELTRAIADRTPAAMITVVSGTPVGAKMLISGDAVLGSLGDPALDSTAVEVGRELLRAERSETRTVANPGDGAMLDLFVDVHMPAPTLLIFGAVHVAQVLARFAKALGFRVVVTDARAPLATRERFPEADQIVQAWPDDALLKIPIERNTYIAILTHDPKFDEPALLGALATDARYIGAVGSRKTNVDRRERLIAAGVAPERIGRIRGPIGLDIGADTPEEMAISILAEIIAVRHGRTGGALTTATGKIRGDG